MRVLFIGDIFGKPGMQVMHRYLSRHRQDYDLVIANGENATNGAGLSRKHFEEMLSAGVDTVTLGNHTWGNREILEFIEETPRLVRPMNYPSGTPGLGYTTVTAKSGERLLVASAMGRVFMDALDCPFRALDDLLETTSPNTPILVDFHAEATSEKRAMLYHLAGRVAGVVGTHTHVQTADERVFKGTAYITDVGMTGVQNSAIGMDFEEVHYRFLHKMPRRYKPAEGEGGLCGVVLELSGTRATSITRVQWQEEVE